jgi:hypothetical protein
VTSASRRRVGRHSADECGRQCLVDRAGGSIRPAPTRRDRAMDARSRPVCKALRAVRAGACEPIPVRLEAVCQRRSKVDPLAPGGFSWWLQRVG